MQDPLRTLTGNPKNQSPGGLSGLIVSSQKQALPFNVNMQANSSQPRLLPFEEGRLSNNNTPMEQARIRAHSPLRVMPAYDLNNSQTSSLLNSAPQPGPIRRPMSQVPSHTRNYASTTNETGSISNYERKGVSPNLAGNKSLSGFSVRDKEGLRSQISTRNRNIKQLAINKKFFEEHLTVKNNDFKEKMRTELKSKIFDKTMKSTLHYIYKHYENLRSNIGKQEAQKVFNNNIEKQNGEIQLLKKGLGDLEKSNRAQEQTLLLKANDVSLINPTPDLVENVTKEDIEAKIQDLQKHSADIEKSLAEMKKWKDKKLYDLKFKHENKGRRMMERKAAMMALEYVEPSDSEQMALKHQVEVLLKEIDLKNQTRKAIKVYQLEHTKKELMKELELLKLSNS